MIKLGDKCNIQVPMEVLNLIDDGKNPDEFTRDVLNSCIAKNQITKGKTDAFKGLRKHLLEELDQAFPDEVEAYREIRATSAAVSYKLNCLCSPRMNFSISLLSLYIPSLCNIAWCQFYLFRYLSFTSTTLRHGAFATGTLMMCHSTLSLLLAQYGNP